MGSSSSHSAKIRRKKSAFQCSGVVEWWPRLVVICASMSKQDRIRYFREYSYKKIDSISLTDDLDEFMTFK